MRRYMHAAYRQHAVDIGGERDGIAAGAFNAGDLAGVAA